MPAGIDGAQEGIAVLLGAVWFKSCSERKDEGSSTRPLAQKSQPTFGWKPQDKLQFCTWPLAVSDNTLGQTPGLSGEKCSFQPIKSIPVLEPVQLNLLSLGHFIQILATGQIFPYWWWYNQCEVQ